MVCVSHKIRNTKYIFQQLITFSYIWFHNTTIATVQVKKKRFRSYCYIDTDQQLTTSVKQFIIVRPQKCAIVIAVASQVLPVAEGSGSNMQLLIVHIANLYISHL